MIRKKIIKLVQEATGVPIKEIQVERLENRANGDYATNIAMVIAKKAKKGPIEIAKLINSKFKTQNSKFLNKVEIAGPGFINFFISKEYLQKQVKEILKKKEGFGQLDLGKNKKINVEFISANPVGLLHIGNSRGAFFGDTISNVLERAGFKVAREYYINDAKKSNQIQALGKTTLERGTIYLTEKLKTQISRLPSLRSGECGQAKLKTTTQNLKPLEHPSEFNLIKQLIRFPEIIEDTAKNYQAQRIPQYAMDSATAFHQFYRDRRVLTEDGPLSKARLALVLAAKIVLKNTLALMGLSAPEKM